MSSVTAGEKALLRGPNHETKLWLSIYQPPIVFTGNVGDPDIEKGAIQVAYINATGSYNLILNGMTMYVGSTPGGDEYGRIRVKSANSSYIEVAENDYIDWTFGAYLTVVKFYEIWPVLPRYIMDDVNVTIYKDYNIAYTDQNKILGTFLNMGPHHAAFIEPDTGVAQVYFTAVGSRNLIDPNDTLLYDWVFEGSTTTGSTNITPGNRAWDTPGHYTVRLNITASNGAVDTSYRHVSIYERPESGTAVPILNWELSELNGDRENGGYTGRIRIKENVSKDVVKDGALVVIFADDYYDGTKQSIGGDYTNRDSIVFVGYIINGSVRYDWRTSTVEFEVGSPTEIMKQSEVGSISVESKFDPESWWDVYDLTIRRAVYHYLRWHSTVMKCTDVNFYQSFDGTTRIKYFEADRTSLYDAINDLMSDGMFGNVVSTRQGKIMCEKDYSIISDELRNASYYTYGMELTSRDWIGEPVIEELISPTLGYIEAGGVAFAGEGSPSIPYLACAPGDVPGVKGSVETHQGLALNSQTQLNELIGDYYAMRNTRFNNVTVNLKGNYRNYDIAQQELVKVYLQQQDTFRGLQWDGKEFMPQSVSLRYNAKGGTLLVDMTMRELTKGFPGDTIPIPDQPTDTDTTIPNPPATPPVGDPAPFGSAIVWTAEGPVYLTENFWNNPPTWSQIGNQTTTRSIGCAKNGRMVYVALTKHLLRIPDVFNPNLKSAPYSFAAGGFDVMLTPDAGIIYQAFYEDVDEIYHPYVGWQFGQVSGSPYYDGIVYLTAVRTNSIDGFFIGKVVFMTSFDFGATWSLSENNVTGTYIGSNPTYGYDQIDCVIDHGPYPYEVYWGQDYSLLKSTNFGQTFTLMVDNDEASSPYLAKSFYGGSSSYRGRHGANGNGNFLKTTNDFSSTSDLGDTMLPVTSFPYQGLFAMSLDGQVIMRPTTNAAVISTDGGSSFGNVAVTGLINAGRHAHHMNGDKFALFGTNALFATENNGGTWNNKTSGLPFAPRALVPLFL